MLLLSKLEKSCFYINVLNVCSSDKQGYFNISVLCTVSILPLSQLHQELFLCSAKEIRRFYFPATIKER